MKISRFQVKTVLDSCVFIDQKIGEKTTVLLAQLPNGFELIAHSACVNPKDYDHAKGVEICKQRIMNQLWSYLGFFLQDLVSNSLFFERVLLELSNVDWIQDNSGVFWVFDGERVYVPHDDNFNYEEEGYLAKSKEDAYGVLYKQGYFEG